MTFELRNLYPRKCQRSALVFEAIYHMILLTAGYELFSEYGECFQAARQGRRPSIGIGSRRRGRGRCKRMFHHQVVRLILPAVSIIVPGLPLKVLATIRSCIGWQLSGTSTFLYDHAWVFEKRRNSMQAWRVGLSLLTKRLSACTKVSETSEARCITQIFCAKGFRSYRYILSVAILPVSQKLDVVGPRSIFLPCLVSNHHTVTARLD